MIVSWLGIPLLALFLSGCSKEGESSNPKIKDKAPNLKQLQPNGGPEDKKAAPTPG
jgi:hypothetical protein